MFKRFMCDETAARAPADRPGRGLRRKRSAFESAIAGRRDGVYFTLGRRRLLTVPLRLAKLQFTLEDILAGRIPPYPDLTHADGVRIRSLPTDRRHEVLTFYSGLLPGVLYRYRRHFIEMEGRFEGYLARFSGKTRSTLRRKVRRLSDASGGELDVRDYRGVDGLAAFLRIAQPLSDRTYQGRLLNAGLPSDPTSRQSMLALAAEDRVRAFLLFFRGEAIAYLYLPVVGRTLIYAHLGFDGRFSYLSPGSVLQFAALERLFAEGTFRYFDFTEGEGQHKSLFATNSIACETQVLLKPTLSNRALLALHKGFCATVRGIKVAAKLLGADAKLHRALRT
jgi:hypothetical protein